LDGEPKPNIKEAACTDTILNATLESNTPESFTVFSTMDSAMSDVRAPLQQLLTSLVVNSIDASQRSRPKLIIKIVSFRTEAGPITKHHVLANKS